MRFILFICVAFVVFAGPLEINAISDTPEPSRAYELGQIDVIDYDLEFDLDDSSFYWRVDIEFVVKAEDSIYYLDYIGTRPLMCYFFDPASDLWLTAEIHYDDSLLGIEARGLSVGDTSIFSAMGTDIPYGTGFYRDPGGGQMWIYTLFWPSLARYAFPCVDHPGDRATATLKVTATEGMIVAGGGSFVDSTASTMPEGLVTWTFRYDQPVCTYNISFSAGAYAEIETTALGGALPVKSYAYPSRLTQTQYDFGRIPEMIALWDSLFGPYPFATVGCAVVPMDVWGGAGGMEHQTLPQIGDMLITGSRTYEEVVAHELAHQWFGDCIGIADWADFWLNEGIAVYSEVLWVVHTDGAGAARAYMTNEENSYKNWTRTNADFPIYDPASFLSPIPYNKGACWWHMLRWQIGDDDFFAFLRYYFDRFAFKTVVTDSLKIALEDFTGRGWDDFFQQWIYEQGYPEFLYDERVGRDSLGWFVDVNLRQTQTAPSCTLFTTPLPLELVTHDSSIAVIFAPTSRFQWERFRAPDSIEYVHFDRLNYICGNFTFDPVGIDETPALPGDFNISVFPNPFNSAVRISIETPSLSPPQAGEMPQAEGVQIEVFDLNGRRVAELIPPGPPLTRGEAEKSPLSKGVEEKSPLSKGDLGGLVWSPDETLPSGVYLVRARTDGGAAAEVKRVVYLK